MLFTTGSLAEIYSAADAEEFPFTAAHLVRRQGLLLPCHFMVVQRSASKRGYSLTVKQAIHDGWIRVQFLVALYY